MRHFIPELDEQSRDAFGHVEQAFKSTINRVIKD